MGGMKGDGSRDGRGLAIGGDGDGDGAGSGRGNEAERGVKEYDGVGGRGVFVSAGI